MKEYIRKLNFMKSLGLVPNKNPKQAEQKDEIVIDESVCFYYYDDNGQVVCRSCLKTFETWLNYKMHFNTSCHVSEAEYKYKKYNDVYQKYKLKNAKNQKTTSNYWNCSQHMNPETLNTRKTRNRCYQNTVVAPTNLKRSQNLSTLSLEKLISANKIKRKVPEISVNSDIKVKEIKPKTFVCKTVQDISEINSNTKYVPNVPPHSNQLTSTINIECKASDISQVLSDKTPNSDDMDILWLPLRYNNLSEHNH